MKKLILFFLLIPSLLFAQDWQEAKMNMGIIGGSVPAAGGDSCTGTLLFSWHGENADVTLGTPAGCSAGDTVGTAVSGANISNTQFWDGGNSVSFPTVGDYYTFDSASIFSSTEGTIVFKLYPTAIGSGDYVFGAWIDADNNFVIRYTGTDEMYATWRGQATSQNAITTDANILVDVWRTVTVKWNTADVNPNLWIQVCDTDNLNCTTAISNNNNLVAWSGSLSTFHIGDYGSGGSTGFIDAFKIYNSVTP